mgnify:CR=1 FL=1
MIFVHSSDILMAIFDIIDAIDDFLSRVLTLILIGDFCDIRNGNDLMPNCGSLILMVCTKNLKRQRKPFC